MTISAGIGIFEISIGADFSIIGDVVPSFALISTVQRKISTLMPDITLEELHRDDTTITVHPVETGSPINDHKFENPCTVEMRVGWSDSSHQSAGYVQSVYEKLLALKKSTEPFDVMTGKRRYKNMLIKSIVITTDESSEFCLNASVTLQEIIIVDVGMGSGAGGGGSESGGTEPAGKVPETHEGAASTGGSSPLVLGSGGTTFASLPVSFP
jgi:hypothetical protein